MRAVVASGWTLALIGCQSPVVITLPDFLAYFDGEIVEVTQHPPAIWAKESPSAQCGMVFSLAEAAIADSRSSRPAEATGVSALEVGMRVRVWLPQGAFISDACPGGAPASFVEVY